MKRLIQIGLGILCVVGTAFLLFPELRRGTSPQVEWRRENPELAALEDLLTARQDSIRSLRSARERLLALETARRLPKSNASFVFSSDPNTIPTTRALFEERVRAELASVGDSIRYPIRVHLGVDSLSEGSYVRVLVLPRSADQPCGVVILVAQGKKGATQPIRNDPLIGVCGFYATFGAAGPGMTKWLIDTRGVHAATHAAPPMEVPDKRHRIAPGELARAPEAAACAAGNEALCAQAWSGAQWVRNLIASDSQMIAATAGTVRGAIFGAQFVPGRNLSDLRVAMTDARFAELWRSDHEPPVAYEEIEGRSIGAFVRDRILTEVEPHRPGPLRAELPLLLGILVAVSCFAVTIRFTKRQRS